MLLSQPGADPQAEDTPSGGRGSGSSAQFGWKNAMSVGRALSGIHIIVHLQAGPNPGPRTAAIPLGDLGGRHDCADRDCPARVNT